MTARRQRNRRLRLLPRRAVAANYGCFQARGVAHGEVRGAWVVVRQPQQRRSRATRGRRCSPSSCPGTAGRASTAGTPRVPSTAPHPPCWPPTQRMQRTTARLLCRRPTTPRCMAGSPSRTLLLARSSSTAQRPNSQTAGAKIILMGARERVRERAARAWGGARAPPWTRVTKRPGNPKQQATHGIRHSEKL
jgi:hypothetical protein